MLKHCLLTFSLFVISFCVSAQNTHRDSVTKIAQADTRNFKLSKADMKVFRKDRKNYNADFFKPSIKTVSDTALLRDSAYTTAFRYEAYHKTKNKHSAGHYILGGYLAINALFLAGAIVLAVLLTAAS